MRIVIGERQRPFSHRPGVRCLLPRSGLEVEVFPTLVRIGTKEILLPISGPVRPFTVELDLEKGRIVVFGQTECSAFRYEIVQEASDILLRFDRGADYSLRLAHPEKVAPLPFERLSLGTHKALDWELVARRRDCAEILPILLRVGQLTPPVTESRRYGTASLLVRLEQLIETRDKPALKEAFVDLFEAGFRGILAPRLEDDQFQGIVPTDAVPENISALILVQEAHRLIRRLFVQEEGSRVNILPVLPQEFDAGRFCDVQTAFGLMDLEWSKKRIRRLILRPRQDLLLDVQWQRTVKEFRVRRSLKGRGERMAIGTPLQLKAGESLYLDRFEK